MDVSKFLPTCILIFRESKGWPTKIPKYNTIYPFVFNESIEWNKPVAPAKVPAKKLDTDWWSMIDILRYNLIDISPVYSRARRKIRTWSYITINCSLKLQYSIGKKIRFVILRSLYAEFVSSSISSKLSNTKIRKLMVKVNWNECHQRSI